jgi:hypothetical protein
MTNCHGTGNWDADMKTYIGVKIVKAEPEVRNGEDGYKVLYPAEFGKPEYVSWCPKNVFEKHNREVSGDGVPFSKALEAMKKGAKVARKGWNGKNIFLFFVQNIDFQAFIDPIKPCESLPSIAMKTATGEVLVGWLASQTDMLADDWFIVE